MIQASDVARLRERVEQADGKVVCIADVARSSSPVYLRGKDVEEFYVRLNNTTRSLPPSEIHDYIRDRWE